MSDLILHFIKSHDELYLICKTLWLFFPVSFLLMCMAEKDGSRFANFISIMFFVLIVLSFFFSFYAGPQHSYTEIRIIGH